MPQAKFVIHNLTTPWPGLWGHGVGRRHRAPVDDDLSNSLLSRSLCGEPFYGRTAERWESGPAAVSHSGGFLGAQLTTGRPGTEPASGALSGGA